jgi:hypothetical protein
MPGLIEVSADERPAVLTLARDLAAFPAARSADIVLEYGKTTTGLARAAKVLALMEPAARNGIIKTLRPAEIRTLLEMQVVDPLAPPLAPPPAPAATGRAADASANQSPPAADRIESTTATATPRRFVLAGNGTDAWKTLLDTATGVVYNYRGETWVPITRPLQPKPPQPQR